MDKDAKPRPHREYEGANSTDHRGSSSLDAKPAISASGGDTGLLGRIALSATQLAGSVSQGISALDSDALSEAKLGRREGSTSTTQPSEAESSQAQAIYTQRRSEPAKPEEGAASAFRQHMRATAGAEEQRRDRDSQFSTEAIDHKGKGKAGVYLSDPGGRTAEHHDWSSHQVGLAQSLDGQDVAKLLSQTMPASISTGPARTFSYDQQPPQLEHQRQPQPRAIDPVAYLQGATYAADMELFDHQVPHDQAARGAADGQALAASPGGASRGWDEHGASVLEEWQLNEAWDRAWMDTAWGSAQKKAPAEPRAEPVLPSHKNLSYLLKPRI